MSVFQTLRRQSVSFVLASFTGLVPLSVSLSVDFLHPIPALAQTTDTSTEQPSDTTSDQTSEPAPDALVQVIEGLNRAANDQDIDAVMAFYGSEFMNSDGLNHEALEEGLVQFWQRCTTLEYQTNLKSWKQEGAAIVAVTETQIFATEKLDGRELALSAVITSEQRVENGKIVQQQILMEETQFRSGEEPPTVTFDLPKTVGTEAKFDIDVVIQEPLNRDLLLGTVVEEPVRPRGYFVSAPFQLEQLSAGGLFKLGEAPSTPQTNWVSAILIRPGGMTAVTRRLQVVEEN
ncbi:MAG: nuclear transport factor 2 family protein [Microcoleaceae cyanobacterium]